MAETVAGISQAKDSGFKSSGSWGLGFWGFGILGFCGLGLWGLGLRVQVRVQTGKIVNLDFEVARQKNVVIDV